MKQIKELAKNIKEELHDAEKYADLALEYKDSDRQLADVYYALAKQEVEHGNIEHEQVVRLIRDTRAKGVEPPPAMLAVWDWEHGQIIDEQKEIALMLDMYKK